MPIRHAVLIAALAAALCVTAAHGQEKAPPLSPSLYQDLRYRVIGPHRASRTVGAVGIPTQPGVFFMGVNNGGVWKTDDYGRTWTPIFDEAPTGSVGDIAVSPSHPNVLYVGSGEGLHRPDLGVGDGIFKSTDGGRTWQHVGLPDIQQVGRLVVHPTDPGIVFVAGMGHPYGPNEERGVFRTTNGGRSWDKVLYVNHNTGASQVEIDPADPRTVYAALWEHREGPWENGSFSGPNTGLYKSMDGGLTWRRLSQGLPAADRGGQYIFAIAPSHPRRLYALVGGRSTAGVYRSEDGGDTWAQVSGDGRLGVDIEVHPSNPDIVFAAGTCEYRSDDGGRTWTAIKGAPGGDDPQRLWINPLQPEVMLLTGDQGATISTNGGRTWSSWYNQPTAQLYHVATDNRVPLLGLRRAAGERRHRHREPRQRRADLPPRLDRRRRRRVRVRRTGPAQPGHCLWRARAAVQPKDRTIAERGAGSAALGRVPHPADHAAAVPPGRTADAALREQRAVEDDNRRPAVGDHQSGPFARAAGRAREHRRFQDTGPRHHAPARRDLCRRPIAEGRQPHLGRDRRRADPRDA